MAFDKRKKFDKKKFEKNRNFIPNFREKVYEKVDEGKFILSSNFEKLKEKFQGNTQSLIKQLKEFNNRNVENFKIKSEKFKNFIEVENKNNPDIAKILKTIPTILLSITLLLQKSGKLVKPLVEAYINVMNNDPDVDRTLLTKIWLIIKQYFANLNNLKGSLSTLSAYLTLLYLFVEDIPNVFKRINVNKPLSREAIFKQLIPTLADIEERFIIEPRERLELQRKQKENFLKIKKEKDKLREWLDKHKDAPKINVDLFFGDHKQSINKISKSQSKSKGKDKDKERGVYEKRKTYRKTYRK